MSHPKAHLWQALQRRFAEQNKASTSSDLLIRSLKVMPLNGQESSSSWSLGFMETGAVRRTVSLSKDFIATAALVQPSVPCYLIMFVGDVSQVKLPDPKAQWLLVSYVPAAASPLLMKQMADNRAGLKAVLGESSFAGDLWCTTADQITLFDSVGFATEDFSALRYVHDQLEATGHYDQLDMIAHPDDPRDMFGMVQRAKAQG